MVMLDEPMAGVNPALTQSLLGHVKALRDDGMTVMFVEHDMDVVHDISDWVIVMGEGRIIAEGTPDQISTNHAVIDAYLGAHHDAPLTAAEEQAQLGRGRGRHRGRAGGRRWLTSRAADGRARRSSPTTRTTGTARCSSPRDIVAGYVPGVDILNGCDLELFDGRAGRHHRPERRRQVDAAQGACSASSPCARARSSSGARTSPRPRPTAWWRWASATCPRTTTCSRASPSQENLEMGVYQRPRDFGARFDEVCDLFPLLGQRRKQRAGSLSGGERQMVAMGRALMMRPSVLLLDEPSAGLSPAYQDEVFIRCRQINDTGVSIVMVEQNARRCLQICHRGFVLDQGRNAYTGTGDELMNDPKVIELYLGTLAKAEVAPQAERHDGGGTPPEREGPCRSGGLSPLRGGLLAGVEALAEGVADVAVDHVGRDVVGAEALLDERRPGAGSSPRSR